MMVQPLFTLVLAILAAPEMVKAFRAARGSSLSVTTEFHGKVRLVMCSSSTIYDLMR